MIRAGDTVVIPSQEPQLSLAHLSLALNHKTVVARFSSPVRHRKGLTRAKVFWVRSDHFQTSPSQMNTDFMFSWPRASTCRALFHDASPLTDDTVAIWPSNGSEVKSELWV
uniref:Uncharacterized protein n=1 Tax=Cannabis sativa TaxID=3483 RepID=A0A803P1R7_CANSA